MNHFPLLKNILAILFFLTGACHVQALEKHSVIDRDNVIASVNNVPITLEELNRAVAASHPDIDAPPQKAGKIDFSSIIKRLLDTRLIIEEGESMGLSELPEIITLTEKYSRQTMIELLLENKVKDLTVDDSEVITLYKKKVREWQLTAIKFKTAEDAGKIEAELQLGGDFNRITQMAIKSGIAEGYEKGTYLKNEDLNDKVEKIISSMTMGSVSPVINLEKKGFILFRLENFRYPEKENLHLKKDLRTKILNEKKIRAAKNYCKELKKKYIRIDSELLGALDFEAKSTGFDTFLKDKRVVARIKGEPDFTVSDLAKALKDKFFHGVERAIKRKTVNKKKHLVLEDRLQQKVLLIEALKAGMGNSDDYRKKMNEYKNSLIFGMFIEKVIVPEIRINNSELIAWYEKNLPSYSSPQMIRMKSLLFSDKKNAREAFQKLTNGTDFDWLCAHTESILWHPQNDSTQLDGQHYAPLGKKFDGRLLSLNSLPEDIKELVSNATSESFRLHEDAQGNHYVFYITQVFDSNPEPFEKVSQKIKKAVFKKKVKTSIENWASQLKSHYPVVVYRTDLKY